jgi:hypothetical protein
MNTEEGWNDENIGFHIHNDYNILNQNVNTD